MSPTLSCVSLTTLAPAPAYCTSTEVALTDANPPRLADKLPCDSSNTVPFAPELRPNAAPVKLTCAEEPAHPNA